MERSCLLSTAQGNHPNGHIWKFAVAESKALATLKFTRTLFFVFPSLFYFFFLKDHKNTKTRQNNKNMNAFPLTKRIEPLCPSEETEWRRYRNSLYYFVTSKNLKLFPNKKLV